MSIEASISKTLIIDSPEYLYKILNHHKNLVEGSLELKIFFDQMNLTVDGCNCDVIEYMAGAMDLYAGLHEMSENSIKLMKSTIGCNKLLFKIKDQNLFEL